MSTHCRRCNGRAWERLSLLLLMSLTSTVLVVSGFSSTSSTTVRDARIRQTNWRQETRIHGESNSDDEMFEDYSAAGGNVTATTKAKFGESVPLKRKPVATDPSTDFMFGDSVPLQSKKASVDGTTDLFAMADATATSSSASSLEEPQTEIKAMKRRNLAVAIASVFLAVSSYVWQFTHPITPVQLLATMQSNSAPLTSIGTNGRPTVVDFWAPWCENCKQAAPTLQKLEEEYKDSVNFVMVNGDRPEAWPLIELFGVDAIPHLALISSEGDVETALIGPIPKRILEADLDVLIANAKLTTEATTTTNEEGSDNPQQKPKELPYKMLDVFANYPEYRRVKFVLAEPEE